MHNDCTAVWWNHTTFPHEVGHYFDLFHTHETAYGRECVDGSNCTTAGDRLCDTPADPGLGAHNVNDACQYIGHELDPCHGDPYSPIQRTCSPRRRHSVAPVSLRCRSRRPAPTLFNLRPELFHPALPAPYDCNDNDVRDDCDIGPRHERRQQRQRHPR